MVPLHHRHTVHDKYPEKNTLVVKKALKLICAKKIIILQINCLKNKFFLVGMLSKSQEEPIIQFCLSFCFFNNDKKDHPKLRGSMYSLRNCRPFSNLDISFANLNERSESGSHVFFFFQEIILADVISIII